MEKLCPVCKKNPLTGKQRLCSSACRSAKYREAQKQRAERITSQQPEPQQNALAKPVRKRAAIVKRREPPRTESQGLQKQMPSRDEMLRATVAELRGLLNRSAASPRIDMREQVVARAPKGAVGYRLVLPNRDGTLPPKLIPRRTRSNPNATYSLTPFEYPDDLRLSDGCWYRIVWIDAQGNRIRAERGAPIPGLCVVLSPGGQTQHPSSVQSETERAVAATLPKEPSTEVKALTESPSVMQLPSVAEVRSSEPAALAETSSVEITERVTAEPVTAEPAPTECPSVTPLPSEPVVPPDATALPAISASSDAVSSVPIESASVTETAQTPSVNLTENPLAPPLWPGSLVTNTDGTLPPAVRPKPLPKSQLDPFWDGPGKFAKRLESLAQVLYEQRLSAAQEAGFPLPIEPLTQLSREERKEIRRAASHEFWKALGVYLNQRFARAKRKGIGAVASLPIVPTPLDEKDQRLMDEVLASPEKRVYLDYLYARRDALLVGDPLPKEPVSRLSAPQRKRLSKIVADVRPIAELLSREEEE